MVPQTGQFIVGCEIFGRRNTVKFLCVDTIGYGKGLGLPGLYPQCFNGKNVSRCRLVWAPGSRVFHLD